MAFDVELLEEAKADYYEIIAWYELQKQGLGTRFYSRMNQIFQKLELQPSNYSYYHKLFRHTIIKGFPHRVVFKVEKTKWLSMQFFTQAEARKNFANVYDEPSIFLCS